MNHPSHNKNRPEVMGSYLRFFAMIATSTVAMFVLMYLHSYAIFDHAWFSETRLFMALIMASAMIVVMLTFMLGMYPNRLFNMGIYVAAGLLFALSLWLVRSQVTVTDVDYMEGMIPHHSIAILTSERSRIEDQRVRALADAIIDAQRREIKEMEWLIDDIRANGIVHDEKRAQSRPIPEFKPASD